MKLKLNEDDRYGTKNNKDIRYILVVVDKLIKFGQSIALENEAAQVKTYDFSNNNHKSNRKSSLVETHD